MLFEPSPGGAALAVAAIAAGAPLFTDGLRALRLRRLFSRLQERPLHKLPTGLVHVRGRVETHDPIAAPLSGVPCAGFRLDVVTADGLVRATVDRRRPFRLVSAEARAQVLAGRGTWELAECHERTCDGAEELPAALNEVLGALPEWRSLRRGRARVTLVERALRVGQSVHVVAYARQARPMEVLAEVQLAATGTDDEVSFVTSTAAAALPDLWLGPGETLDFLLVTDHPPRHLGRRVAWWRTVNALLGPILGLSGLAYLAHAVDRMRGIG